MSWTVIATWSFSLAGVEFASNILSERGCALDAVEQAARIVEDDPLVDSVGSGGFPNMNGEVELDAAFMDGRDLSIGGVAALKGFPNPVSIARSVLKESQHNLLVDKGAEDFANLKGFNRKELLTDNMKRLWQERKADMEKGKTCNPGHDTVGIVALDLNGDMAAATSTSGLPMKFSGRVGDSPLVGSGFYVDNEAGGATATGVGEDIMKGCICFYAVELMRQGFHPQKAAEEAVRRIHKRLAKLNKSVGAIAIVCADNKGNFGGAANHGNFQYAAASDNVQPTLFDAVSLKDLQ